MTSASDDLKAALVRFDEECAAYLEHVQSGYALARKDLEARIAAETELTKVAAK